MRWLKRLLILLLVLVVGLGVFGFLTVRASFPQLNGEVEVTGLGTEVQVIRDEYGIPHIYASTVSDLFRAQGYVEAQDRFFQMDFWRHIGSARLSEMFGDSQVETDKFLRAFDFAGTAEVELEMMSEQARNILEWYSAGINAYLVDHQGASLSLEYAILPLSAPGYEPEPWSPVDTLTWAKVMSWDLSGNFSDEVSRSVLAETLTVEQVEQLFPPYPDNHPVIVPDELRAGLWSPPVVEVPEAAMIALHSADTGRRAVNSLTGGGFEGIGSNNWVISGAHTASGMPILANDPHLPNQMPSIWYEIGLHCTPIGPDCPFDVVGFTFAGTPGVVIGHNSTIAWGVTTEAADTQDLFIEKLNPQDPGQYEVDGAWVDMQVRSETIEIAGGDPETYDIYTTRHGPIISGLHGGADEITDPTTEYSEGYGVALAWTSLRPSTLVESIIAINLASNWEEFRTAASMWDVAAQNLVYADSSGNIGYQSTGEIPVRPNSDGLRPVPGWETANDWVGTVPFDQMPFIFNPERGYIATANQPVLAAGSLPFIGRDGAYGYRAARIEELINESQGHDVASVQRMQMDNRDGGAANIVPSLITVPTDQPEVLEIQDMLEAWSPGKSGFQAGTDSPGAAAYQATWRYLLDLTFSDDLPEDERPVGGSRWFQVVSNLVNTPEDPLWDNQNTPQVESANEIMEAAMASAHFEMTGLLGSDSEKWRWGDLHLASFENQTLGQSGIAPVEWLLNRSAPNRVAGSDSVINSVGWNATIGYEVDWVPSMRMVIDLGDLAGSTSIHTTGQSGHAFHGNYADMIDMWTDGEQHPMLWDSTQVDEAAVNILILKPLSG
ncbi:MAG TPA: penicillin acylase family protein [Acidimicrobiia bacterium]